MIAAWYMITITARPQPTPSIKLGKLSIRRIPPVPIASLRKARLAPLTSTTESDLPLFLSCVTISPNTMEIINAKGRA